MSKVSLKEEKLLNKKQSQISPFPNPKNPLKRYSFVLLSLSIIAITIYSNTFSSSFHFDDFRNIERNHTIHDLKNFSDFSGSRYIGFLSFGLNYYFGGVEVFGYHLVNLIIHIINALLVYHLALLVFEAVGLRLVESDHLLFWIALSASLLFVSHPIQTQAVTYIVQRFSSLATLFYLLTLVCYLNWHFTPLGSKRRFLWYSSALLSAVLAMKTKEISFTLPIMILAIETFFFQPLTKRKIFILIPFFLTLLIIPFSRLDVVGKADAGFIRQTADLSRTDYLFTQFRVIMTYLRLLIFPMHQNLDYDYPIYRSFFSIPVFFSFLFHVALFGTALLLLIRKGSSKPAARLVGFSIIWFYLTLSIESSIIPIIDVIFEHRLYLPSIGVFMAFTSAVLMTRKRQRILIGIFMVLTLCFSIATYQRNIVWKDEITLWKDVTEKSKRNERASYNLAKAYYQKGMQEEAIKEYQRSLKLRHDFPAAHDGLGMVYADQGKYNEAIEAYKMALKLRPDFAKAHYDLGLVYISQKEWESAILEFQKALQLQPDFIKASINIGTIYGLQGKLEEATQLFQDVLRIHPDVAEAHNNLGRIYATQKKWEEAVEEYKTALILKPDYADAYYNLGNLYKEQGRIAESRRELERALEFNPKDVQIRHVLEYLPN